ncbi:DUF397 domain-containing protein [Streptomyces sp. NRRL S-1521]|uniref:DUF397 domain-containing protein n=1 Tax=Streptomyces sp. NRRL S-1521 TaxID=1609100 RepID=UPI00074AA24D|nr:DUF397 domain-containing protein [Streptomyces sp. NRRL S-1521]KUL53486.1 toxin-antitoxin system, toxin component [Streptomyces sp. NRRL S-1521]
MNAHARQPYIGQLVWRRSSYSSEEGGECVELAARPGKVHVRDSKDTTRTALTVGATAWTAFVGFAAMC